MSSIRINVNAIIIKDDKLLLIKFDDENGVHYNLPGGGLKNGESAITALERECWEEACARVKVRDLCLTWQYVPELENFRFGDRQRIGLIFKAELSPGSEPRLPEKPDPNQIGVEWIALSQIFESNGHFPLFPELLPQLKKALLEKKSVDFVEVSPEVVHFKPIDIPQTRELCVQFRKDSFVASFGMDEKSWPQAFDADRYLEWLEGKYNRDPHAAVHVWLNDKVIGQLELGSLKEEPSVGYVNLYYLAPEYRGKGHSAALDGYAVRYLKSKGHTKARLSVSPTNQRALSFYKKNGWVDLGPRESLPGVHWMEKNLEGQDKADV